jgi:cytochrome b pre-mRNA-processing protein 3
MISLPFRRPRQAPNIDALYGMIVAQARLPAFYLGYGVPDTVAGRLDMIVMHLVLVLRQLSKGSGLSPAAMPPAGQRLFHRFCRDIDDNFREMGVGDLTVPKEMRRVAEAFYGRAKAYGNALDGGDPAALEDAVSRNIYGANAPVLGARRLASYMREASRRLDGQTADMLARGELAFPDPEAVASP